MSAAAFAAGWLVLVVALVSPLDTLGAHLFSAHMVQHELLMVLAAPLLVLGRPLAAWTWAFAPPGRRRIARAVQAHWLQACWAVLTDPVAAWALHALALWLWHVPGLFTAALEHEAVHVLQHASFLATALLFWWAALGGDARAPRGLGSAVGLLFTTMLHTAALGALLSLAPTPWYAPYIASTQALGMDPVDDQQLGGLVMWVPAGLAYLVAALALLGRLLTRQRA
jgi:putative membrane protein